MLSDIYFSFLSVPSATTSPTQPNPLLLHNQWRAQDFCSGEGVQQIQLRAEERENGDPGAVAP